MGLLYLYLYLLRGVQDVRTDWTSDGIAMENCCAHLDLLKEVLKREWQGGMQDLSLASE